jgi:hypothetical protein
MALGDIGRGSGDHRDVHLPQGMSMGGDPTISTPPAMGTCYPSDLSGSLQWGFFLKGISSSSPENGFPNV